MKISKKKGFTLIELLVVVLIIGILSAIALPQYEKTVEKSRAAEGLVLVRAIADAEDRYLMANGEYTIDVRDLDLSFPGVTNAYSGYVIHTKHFDCRPWQPEADSLMRALAVCNRRPQGSVYLLAKMLDGRLVCAYYSDKGKKICTGMAVDQVGPRSDF